ncbi:hypothetical protein D3C76_1198920 [compost metagenome]
MRRAPPTPRRRAGTACRRSHRQCRAKSSAHSAWRCRAWSPGRSRTNRSSGSRSTGSVCRRPTRPSRRTVPSWRGTDPVWCRWRPVAPVRRRMHPRNPRAGYRPSALCLPCPIRGWPPDRTRPRRARSECRPSARQCGPARKCPPPPARRPGGSAGSLVRPAVSPCCICLCRVCRRWPP